MHVAAHRRRTENDAARQELYAAERARNERNREADRAAKEMLERDADLLEDLGLAGLTTDGKGHVRLSVEQLIGIIRRVA